MLRSLPEPHHLPALDAACVDHDEVGLKTAARIAADSGATA